MDWGRYAPGGGYRYWDLIMGRWRVQDLAKTPYICSTLSLDIFWNVLSIRNSFQSRSCSLQKVRMRWGPARWRGRITCSLRGARIARSTTLTFERKNFSQDNFRFCEGYSKCHQDFFQTCQGTSLRTSSRSSQRARGRGVRYWLVAGRPSVRSIMNYFSKV